jgi:hypothetical protein
MILNLKTQQHRSMKKSVKKKNVKMMNVQENVRNVLETTYQRTQNLVIAIIMMVLL